MTIVDEARGNLDKGKEDAKAKFVGKDKAMADDARDNLTPTEIDGLVERLRKRCGHTSVETWTGDLMYEAAAALTAQQARIKELEGALEFYATIDWPNPQYGQRARAALKGGAE
jgi:hypothetical protein